MDAPSVPVFAASSTLRGAGRTESAWLFQAVPIRPRSSTWSFLPKDSATREPGLLRPTVGTGLPSSPCAPCRHRIILGTGISSVFVRTAPTIAIAASSVVDLCNGRFILGPGSCHKAQVGPEHGVAYSKPLTRTRQTVAVVRALLRGGQVRFAGETIRTENFDRWCTPRHQNIPLYLSAVFPKGIALCGEIADGIILTRTLSTLPRGCVDSSARPRAAPVPAPAGSRSPRGCQQRAAKRAARHARCCGQALRVMPDSFRAARN